MAGRQDARRQTKFGFHKADFDHGHKVKQVEGEHDLFGDGSVVCLPTTATRRAISRSGCAPRRARSC